MASITVNTNGQVLTVNASISHWTSAALAVVASGDDDIPSTTTTTITSAYTMHFANTATVVTVTVKQADGTVLLAQEFQCSPAVGPRTLNPLPAITQLASDTGRRELALAPPGALAETYPRVGTSASSQTAAVSGTLYMTAIWVPANTVVSSISYLSGGTGASNPTNQWFALYTSARVLLAQTANDTTTAWGASAVKTLAITAPITTTYSGLHYVGFLVTAATVPTFLGHASSAHAVAPITNGTSTASLTDTAPATAGALTAISGTPYAYIS